MSTSLTTLRPIAGELRRRGIDPWPLLGSIGVEAGDLLAGLDTVSNADLNTLIAQAVSATRDRRFGYTAGLHAPLAALSGLGPLLTSCDDLTHALHVFVECRDLWGDQVRLSVRTVDSSLVLSVRALDLDPLATETLEGVLAGVAVNLAQEISGDRTTGQIEVGASDHTASVESVIAPNDAVRRTTVTFTSAIATAPNIHTDELSRTIFSDIVRGLAAERAGTSLGDRVRVVVRRLMLTDHCNVESVAQALGMTTRALRRRLHDAEKTSVAELVDEERARRARKKLQAGYEIKSISHELGFSEPSSFHRAFKRWTGRSPQQFVREAGASGT